MTTIRSTLLLVILGFSLAGCLAPSDSQPETDGPFARAVVFTAFRPEEGYDLRFPDGPPARNLFLQLLVRRTEGTPPNATWAPDAECPTVFAGPHSYRDCSAIENQTEYIVPPAPEQGPSRVFYYPLDKDGSIRLVFPVEMMFQVSVSGDIDPDLKTEMTETGSCERVRAGRIAKVESLDGESELAFESNLERRWIPAPESSFLLPWYAYCSDGTVN